MNEEKKPYVSPPPEADGNYVYYCLSGVLPIRVTMIDSYVRGMKEAPSPEHNGELRIKHFICAFEKDDDIEQITKEEFIKMVKNYMPERQARLAQIKPESKKLS